MDTHQQSDESTSHSSQPCLSSLIPLIHRHFTSDHSDPFASVKWEKREVAISSDVGKVVFEEKNVEVPSTWSQMAASIVASKYFHGRVGSQKRERSVKTLIQRVVDTIALWGSDLKYFPTSEVTDLFRDELSYILVHQYSAFNSPVWFNVGVHAKPQCSACFIVSVDDTMDSLLELQTIEGRLFKYGSGTGTNLSTIRSSKERLAGGGKPSGPVSFMRALDGWAGVIKSGGKTRRAAKMQILNVDHPDILEFIRCKSDEEKKAWALIEAGYEGSFNSSGGAYDSVAFQNANLSVRVSDKFMEAVEQNNTYSTKTVTNNGQCEDLNAREVLRAIAEGTYLCGDPGIQFDDTINLWHTCPNSGRINASNPCSEYMHLDNSACNLSSLNLIKFLRDDGTFDIDGFSQTVAVMIMAQDILIDKSSYPTSKIEKCAHDFRQLGLGYSNLGALLMCLGLPYDSEEAREWAAHITALLTGEAYLTSARLAKSHGAFAGYKKNQKPMLHVIEMHRDKAKMLKSDHVPQALSTRVKAVWDEALELGKEYGFRNSQTTVLAPTGTISFMMDCDTTGIEPEIALVKYKKLAGGGFIKMVNSSVIKALKTLGYSEVDRKKIVEFVHAEGTIEGCLDLKEEHLAVFDCAFRAVKGQRSIHYLGHLKMMAAAQPFISGAISKTVNFPHDTTVDEIFETYVTAWKLGLKAVALYRDGSKRTQPLSSEKEGKSQRTPVRRRLPEERHAITHKFNVAGLEGYLTVGLYEDGKPGEIFLVVAKEGSTLSGIMDAFATSISMALQYGVPLSDLAKKFTHMRFEPAGFTPNKDIPVAKSVVDYVFKWLALKFLSVEERSSIGIFSATETISKLNGSHSTVAGDLSSGSNGHLTQRGDTKSSSLEVTFKNSEDAPHCTLCGSSFMVRLGACYVCLNCGAQGGCG